MTFPTLTAWHGLVRSRNTKGLNSLLANNAIFQSPQAGKTITRQYLSAALQVFGNDSFHYVREVAGPRDAVLELEVEIDGISVNGVDMLKWDDEGMVVEFKVRDRPLANDPRRLPCLRGRSRPGIRRRKGGLWSMDE